MSLLEIAPVLCVLVLYSTRLVTVFHGPVNAGATCGLNPSAGKVQVIQRPTPSGTQWTDEARLTRQL
jgi:hypothetical protein